MYVCFLSWGPTDKTLFMQTYLVKILPLREQQYVTTPHAAPSGAIHELLLNHDTSGIASEFAMN